MDASDSAERKDRRRAFIGIAILGVLLALAILIISLDEIAEGQTETVDMVAELPESGGLVSGAMVWIAGHEVGEVVSVSLLPPAPTGESRILAVARIPEEHLFLLRGDSRAHITSAQMMGHKILEFSPGTQAAPPLRAGDTIRAEYSPDRMGEALGSARGVMSDVDSLVTNLRHLAALYGERKPAIDALQRSVTAVSVEMDRTSATFANSPLQAAMRDARLAERFAALRVALAEIQSGLMRYTEGPLGENTVALRARADSLSAEIATLDSAAADVSGFIGRFGADSAIARAAGEAGAQMDSLVAEIKSNPFMFF